MNEYLPSVSVVVPSTLPEGLIKTTVMFARATLFASTIFPEILMLVRKRDAAFFKASSDIGCVSVAGADEGADSEGAGAVAVGGEVSVSGFFISSAGVFVSEAGVIVSGVVAVGAGALLLTAPDPAAAPDTAPAPIFSSSPSSDPCTDL